MLNTIDLSKQKWSLSGWTPELWRMHKTMEIGASPIAEVRAMECTIPVSVQQVLLDNRIIKDWNVGFNYKECEWIENRHWIFTTEIEGKELDKSKKYTLSCKGLDYKGEIYLNTKLVGFFDNAYITYNFDITDFLACDTNILNIVFLCPPRWQGQFGFTSKILEFKPRFYYTWDWTCRIVQTGIWDNICIYESDGPYIDYINIETDANLENITGSLSLFGKMTEKTDGYAEVTLKNNEKNIKTEKVSLCENEISLCWKDLPVRLWNIYQLGESPLYDLVIKVYDKDGSFLDEKQRKVGFRNITWKMCKGAPKTAQPWICSVNGKDIFIQGVDWVPIKQNFADVKYEDYKEMLSIYKEIGVNLIRVWGGAVLERESFYNLCDEMGIMVWQEFPMSSSGIDNYPPEDKDWIDGMKEIVSNYVHKRGYHASLIIWCAGNELFKFGETNSLYPIDNTHPLIGEMENTLKEENPGRRFIYGSPTGPLGSFHFDKVGKGLHENTHGPWKAEKGRDWWFEYFENDDSMFKAEAGAPGASSLDILEKYCGDLNAYPIVGENDYWSRPMNWWIETEAFKEEKGRYPETKEEYVEWSQQRQAELLSFAVKTMKDKFPKCGGFIIWMGHDNYPCPANTSIIDYYRRLKPAGLAIKKIFRGE
ncbi:MAG: hypothetical protein IJS60_11200 [Abditibacteriota bacterium]|nr:hypothetical protein [Abditibacteriota bacterium]